MVTLLSFRRCRRDRSSTISLVNFVRERKRLFSNAGEDRWSTIAVFLSDFIPPVILSDIESANALGKYLVVDSLVL